MLIFHTSIISDHQNHIQKGLTKQYNGDSLITLSQSLQLDNYRFKKH